MDVELFLALACVWVLAWAACVDFLGRVRLPDGVVELGVSLLVAVPTLRLTGVMPPVTDDGLLRVVPPPYLLPGVMPLRSGVEALKLADDDLRLLLAVDVATDDLFTGEEPPEGGDK